MKWRAGRKCVVVGLKYQFLRRKLVLNTVTSAKTMVMAAIIALVGNGGNEHDADGIIKPNSRAFLITPIGRVRGTITIYLSKKIF